MNNKVLSIIFIIAIGSNELVSQINQYYKDFNNAVEILTTNVNNKNIEEADSNLESLFNKTDDHHLSDIIKVLNHRSSLGNVQNSFYIDTLVKTAKKFKYRINNNQVQVPIDSKLTIEEINNVRGFCYLPNYTKNNDNIYRYPTINEWCDLVKNY